MSSKTYDFGRDFDAFFPEPAPTTTFVGPSSATGPSATGPVQIPSVDSLPRLGTLLKALPVHYLIFYHAFPARIQCSHEPTLVFLADYLTKHGRTNDNDSERVSRLILAFPRKLTRFR